MVDFQLSAANLSLSDKHDRSRSTEPIGSLKRADCIHQTDHRRHEFRTCDQKVHVIFVDSKNCVFIVLCSNRTYS